MDLPFSSVVASLADLRTVVGEPGEVARRKQIDHLDAWCRDYLARAPYVLMATSDARGRCDVSPKGDRPGFVHVVDDCHLAIPERPGNRRLDSVTNLFDNPHVGLLFVVPGFDETLRVNGRACLTRDPDLLARMTVDGKAPIFAFGIAVDEVFVHCAKAAKPSRTAATRRRSTDPSGRGSAASTRASPDPRAGPHAMSRAIVRG